MNSSEDVKTQQWAPVFKNDELRPRLPKTWTNSQAQSGHSESNSRTRTLHGRNIPFLSRTNPKWLGHTESSFKFHRSRFFLCSEEPNICFGIFNFCSGKNVTWKREDKSIDERGIARTASDLKQFIGNLCLWSIRRRRFLKDNSGVAAKWSRTYFLSPLARVVYPRRVDSSGKSLRKHKLACHLAELFVTNWGLSRFFLPSRADVDWEVQ